MSHTLSCGEYAGQHRCRPPGPLRRWAQRRHQARIDRISADLGLNGQQQLALQDLQIRWRETRSSLATAQHALVAMLTTAVEQAPLPGDKSIEQTRERLRALEQSTESLVADLAAFSDGLEPEQRDKVLRLLRR